MASFQRPQVATLYSRLAEPPRQLIALFGPRQTGKTTIVRQALRQIDLGSRYLAVDEPDSTGFRVPSAATEATFLAPQVRDAEWLVRHWEEARRTAEQLGRIRAGVRRDSEDSPVVGDHQGPLGRRPRQRLPLARGHPRLGPAAHAIGIEREPRRPL